MKVVIDTNVFLSGVFFKGPPFQILQAWREGAIQMVVSPEILEEYRRVGEILSEEYPAIEYSPILEFVIHNAIIYAAPPLPERVCVDPDDDKFLACALAGKSNLVISGDKHLLTASGYKKVEILSPREFLNRYPSK